MKENQTEKPRLTLRKEYRDEMEAENLSIMEYLEKKKIEREEIESERIAQALKDNPVLPRYVSSINLSDNLTDLGYEKQFFTREDAEFIEQQIDKWEEENSMWEPMETPSEQREKSIQTLVETGIRYDFKKLNITIYATWGFDLSNYDDGSTAINYGFIAYLYNHNTKEFREINDEEHFEITS